MELFIKGFFTPIGHDNVKIDVHPTNPYKEFHIEDILVCLYPKNHIIIAIIKIDAPDGSAEYFGDAKKEIPRNEVYEQLLKPLLSNVQKIIKYLKYFYGIYELDEDYRLNQYYEWSINNKDWLPVPDKRETAWRGINPIYVLDDRLLGWIPKLIERGIEPFFAFTHLHKAFLEQNCRHKWINATIAAELAFKEFLAQYDTRATSLITHVPSPPLNRLYRDVLKEYTGVESPMQAVLGNGATLRNHLIHKTTEPTPTIEKTNIYIHQVQVAIFHLYSLLYKDDPFFNYLLKHAEGKLEHTISRKGKPNNIK